MSFLRLLGSNWTLFWRMFMTNRSYKREKQSSHLPMVAATWRPARWRSKWATATTVSESQFRQCRNSALPHPLLSPWVKHCRLLVHGRRCCRARWLMTTAVQESFGIFESQSDHNSLINPIWHGLFLNRQILGGGMRGPHHNFVVIAPMITKFGTGIKLGVLYTMVTKNLWRHYYYLIMMSQPVY